MQFPSEAVLAEQQIDTSRVLPHPFHFASAVDCTHALSVAGIAMSLYIALHSEIAFCGCLARQPSCFSP
jgi:hypothetical protein